MVMNFYILLLVSLPEAFLNIIIILLFAGAKDKLHINKSNIVRFSITLVSMLVASEIIRPLVPNVVINAVFHIIAYMFIFTLVYKLKLTYAFLSITLMYLIYSTIENSYIPYIITYVCGGIENLNNSYHLFPLYAMPYRVGQIIVILFLWKNDILLITKINKSFHKLFIITSSILIIIEYNLGYLFYNYFNNMTLYHQISLSISLIAMVIVLNLLVFKIIYIVINKIVVNGYEKHLEFEEDALFALEQIQDMLKDNKVEDAIKLIDNLKGIDYND